MFLGRFRINVTAGWRAAVKKKVNFDEVLETGSVEQYVVLRTSFRRDVRHRFTPLYEEVKHLKRHKE